MTTEQSNYVCEMCGYQSTNQQDVLDHLTTEHGVTDPAFVDSVGQAPAAPLFSLGLLVVTPAAENAIQAAEADLADLLRRHVSGDFGSDINQDDHDSQANRYAIEHGGSITSSYRLSDQIKVRVVTYCQTVRDYTSVMLPEEYS